MGVARRTDTATALDRRAGLRCTTGVKLVWSAVPAGVAALVLCASAAAKVGIAIHAADRTPAVGQRLTVVVRSARPLPFDLRLMAVAPGQDVFSVVATITGDTSHPDPTVARDGFEIRLHRARAARGPGSEWHGSVRFPRPGRWLVVVPNEAPVGVMEPHGAALLAVAVHPAG
jgi:hypothetical protein